MSIVSNELITFNESSNPPLLRFDVGSIPNIAGSDSAADTVTKMPTSSNNQNSNNAPVDNQTNIPKKTNVFVKYTFDNFVEGKSNQLARAAASQVSDNPVQLITHYLFMVIPV